MEQYTSQVSGSEKGRLLAALVLRADAVYRYDYN
jgi:hypothetical protein